MRWRPLSSAPSQPNRRSKACGTRAVDDKVRLAFQGQVVCQFAFVPGATLMRVWLPTVRAGSGADVFTLRLAEGLSESGVDARITWFPRGFELVPDLMRFQAMPAGTDIIHANGWLACPFLGRRVPVVTTVLHLVHDPAYAPYRTWSQALYHNVHIRRRERSAILKSDAVTTNSHYVARTVECFSGREPVVIPNWVDTTLYCPDSSQRAPVPSDPYRLLMVGNRTRRKGADLIPAFIRALGSRIELRCTGGLRSGREQDLSGVRWLGALTEAELVAEYQRCDAVVSPSGVMKASVTRHSRPWPAASRFSGSRQAAWRR